MEKKNTFTKALAIVGNVLVWLPLLAPILLAIIMLPVEGRFLFDFLMPAELFPMIFIGSALLLWATLRAHVRVKLVVWGFSLAVLVLAGGQWLAIVSGLASGDIEPAGWIWGLVTASLAIYWLGLIVVGTGGAMLLRDLFKGQLPSV